MQATGSQRNQFACVRFKDFLRFKDLQDWKESYLVIFYLHILGYCVKS